jgi:class 3 adenylate cyclase
MLLRIGVHVGELIVEDDGDVVGDVVNIAARLEGRAHAGGVCVSDDVYRRLSEGSSTSSTILAGCR